MSKTRDTVRLDAAGKPEAVDAGGDLGWLPVGAVIGSAVIQAEGRYRLMIAYDGGPVKRAEQDDERQPDLL